ncbi:maleylpyruvate isomerase family mycothiol-dependent enzyme [Nonomuraea sp. NPDC005983]|uniref:maleylpyruvate isomerase family mycothiol-dependent enzyme n=1 Tax=Nonomuraea sp. NPDC005983 TaxID=3155595 RepID=UPI0033B3B134
MTVLPALQAELAAATDRLLATAARLSDDDVAAPSRLPGWSRGHVLAHVARNADSHIRLLTWAKTGVKTPQYPTARSREAEIEAQAARSAAEHLADLRDSAARLDAAVRDLPEQAWQASVAGMRPPDHPAWYCLVRRLREVGMHHVDLGAGYGPSDWPEAFVLRELHDCAATWPRESSPIRSFRLPATEWKVGEDGPSVEGAPADMLAWLTGRSGGEGIRLVPEGRTMTPGPAALPAPPPWLIMPAPADLPATPPEDYP